MNKCPDPQCPLFGKQFKVNIQCSKTHFYFLQKLWTSKNQTVKMLQTNKQNKLTAKWPFKYELTKVSCLCPPDV